MGRMFESGDKSSEQRVQLAFGKEQLQHRDNNMGKTSHFRRQLTIYVNFR